MESIEAGLIQTGVVTKGSMTSDSSYIMVPKKDRSTPVDRLVSMTFDAGRQGHRSIPFGQFTKQPH
jgi:hypothetical protein